ncbi:hypothetical protein [Streptomyces sp. R33]|uniref:Uncharacterized protein n=1 Tax=Streptomyces sp. R33 TaxID=3238629 RepID=A0AB39XUX8_9ACTN
MTAAITTAAPAAPAVETTRHQSLHAWTLLNEHGPGPNPGERLTARVVARTTTGDQARGHATIQHVFLGGRIVKVEMSIDCLTTDGAAVTVTGPIDALQFTVPAGETPPPAAPSTWHPETGLTFYPADEHGERQVGWAGADRWSRGVGLVALDQGIDTSTAVGPMFSHGRCTTPATTPSSRSPTSSALPALAHLPSPGQSPAPPLAAINP